MCLYQLACNIRLVNGEKGIEIDLVAVLGNSFLLPTYLEVQFSLGGLQKVMLDTARYGDVQMTPVNVKQSHFSPHRWEEFLAMITKTAFSARSVNPDLRLRFGNGIYDTTANYDGLVHRKWYQRLTPGTKCRSGNLILSVSCLGLNLPRTPWQRQRR
ncbi:hypothetical protein BJX99DRAFT_181613 [Aspergillus californicus]